MSKPLAAAPDAERVTVDYLTTAMAARGETCTVGVVIPTVAWTPTTTSHWAFCTRALSGCGSTS